MLKKGIFQNLHFFNFYEHAAHDSFLVTPSTTTPTAGVAIDLTIAAIDEFGNVLDGSYGATAYTGEVWISTTASTPYDIPFSYAYLSGDGGTKTFTSGVLFETAEDGVSITVRDNDDPTIYATVTGINVAASDTTPPVITSMSLDKPAYRLTQDPNVTVVVVEDNTADDVLINGTSGTEDPAGTWTRAFAHGKATAGMYSFTVIASDSTGNENINTVWYSVIEDDDPATPVVAITSPSAGATVDGSTTIQFTTNSGATTDAYISIDGGTYVTATTNANPGTYVLDTTTLSNGSHTLRVKDTVDGVTGYSDYLTFIVNNLEEPTSVTVDRIERTETYATADGTYANGWEWVFHITVPTAETQLYMKFKDWTSGSNTIEVAENMRYYSAQSSNASAEGSAIEIAEAEEYPETAMLLNSDLDAFTGGRQIKVVVQAKVPAGTAGGSYSTSYKVLSEEVAE